MRRESRDHGQNRSLHGRQLWPQQQRHVNPRCALGVPRAPRASSSSGLLFCQDNYTFWFARLPQFKRHAIRRIRLEKVIDALAEKAAFQPLLQLVSCKNVRNFFEEITRGGAAPDLYAMLPKPLDPAPHRGPGHADLPGSARSADGYGAVF